MRQTDTVIVGAGPAGLAVAARLSDLQLPFEILERSNSVASSWRNHYDRLHLHTVREHSALPLKPFPTTYPTYVSRDDLISYCEAYANHFRIVPHYDSTVSRIEKQGRTWIVTTTDDRWSCKHVVVATGTNSVPVLPKWADKTDDACEVIHSRDYTNALPFVNKRILVVGMGNTGAEIALDLCENNVDVSISLRGPVNIVPRDAFGGPAQVTGMKLDRLPNRVQDVVTKLAQKITVGNLDKYGIATPKMSPSEQLRTSGKSPVLDLGTVAKIEKGEITIFPGVKDITNAGITFADGRTTAFDAVVCSTGYQHDLKNFIPHVESFCDQNDSPAAISGSGNFSGMYFIGFDNYRTQGILANINTDSKTIVDAIAAQ